MTAVSDRLTPVQALRETAHLLERAGGQTRRAQAFRTAAAVVSELSDAERADHAGRQSWTQLPGIGATTGTVLAQASVGRVPEYLARLRAERRELAPASGMARALRGDLHTHSLWSDGGVSVEEMMLTAASLGHEYCAVTDHSPRLRVANGLTAERLTQQLDLIDALNDAMAPFRVLKGIEVDILDDGALDQTPAMLAQLDVVVASVHSKLQMDADAMTLRMVTAVANPRTNVLGHCTGRKVEGGKVRGQSRFDAEVVFEACRQFGVAVEINSRPERCDPPDDLLALAAELGCLFAIDTDAHAPGQLEFGAYGAFRAEQAGIAPERVVNTWPVERLLEWCASRS